ncbi:coiled-coil domain-containing protein 55 [Pestalotiopsis sp. NC0098]|nr:coiled-coil domain-containing protein 55 [Pestalotiopsis sp. NC0098]
MNKPGLSYGLNLTKKPGAKAQPPKAKTGGIFGGGDESESDHDEPQANVFAKSANKSKARLGAPPTAPPKSKKPQMSMYGDLSSALESKRNAEAAEELDPSIYDYDGVYDSIKPEKKTTQEDAERRPKYMKNLLASAAVRKRDALIAEEKKIAREREAEGEEFADKEKFVTEAYKQQQEENRKLEEEEKRREEEEARKNKGGGMTAFYKDLLNKGDQRHAEMMKAAEERAKSGPQDPEEAPAEEKPATATDRARELNEKGGSIAINEDGDVVDKRELLKGGLNLGAKKKPEVRQAERRTEQRDDRNSRSNLGGGKNAMRERQSRMMEAQLEQALKRSLEQEEEERQKVERAAKSRKTETDISSAKERYLARKKAAEEAKKNGS